MRIASSDVGLICEPTVYHPGPNYVIQTRDSLILIGKVGAAAAVQKLVAPA